MGNQDALARALFGWDGDPTHCRMCNGEATSFTDELSKREFAISGMCQKCQDGFFNSSDEEE
jgi:hypothetical protein